MYLSFATIDQSTCQVPSSAYYGVEFGPLSRGTTYYMQMGFVKIPSGGNNGNVYYYVWEKTPYTASNILYSGYHYTDGSYFTVASNYTYFCQYNQWGTDDFTIYEEWYSMNSVEAWPAFNLHTSLLADFVTKIDWTQYEPLGVPSGFTGLMIVPGTTHDWNNLNIDNEPFAVWVGTWFGNGELTVRVSNSQKNTIKVGIDPLADPNGGYTVYYYFDYCGTSNTLPCGDVSFSPGGSTVQPDSYFYSPNAQMIATIPAGFPVGTYTMNLYSYDQGDNSWQICMWWLTVT